MFAICAKKLAKIVTGVCSTHACEAVTEHKISTFWDESGTFTAVFSDPDPDSIKSVDPDPDSDPDPGGQKLPTKIEKS
jgi:hypothetical protein